MTQVVLVDEHDNEIGLKDKVEAHLGLGVMHRAFQVLLFNNKNEVLVVQRSGYKMLWPFVWDGACASHPVKGESYIDAGKRRLVEELGFTCWLDEVDRFTYQSSYGDVGSENELCITLTGNYDGEINPNPDEVASFKWMSLGELRQDILDNSDKYTVWFKIALDRLIEQGKLNQEANNGS